MISANSARGEGGAHDLLGANEVHDLVLSFAWYRAVAQYNAGKGGGVRQAMAHARRTHLRFCHAESPPSDSGRFFPSIHVRSCSKREGGGGMGCSVNG